MMQYTPSFLCQILKDVHVDIPVHGTYEVLTEDHAQRDSCERKIDHGMSGTTPRVVLTGAERPFASRNYQLSDVKKDSWNIYLYRQEVMGLLGGP